jgi:hypothetical protein
MIRPSSSSPITTVMIVVVVVVVTFTENIPRLLVPKILVQRTSPSTITTIRTTTDAFRFEAARYNSVRPSKPPLISSTTSRSWSSNQLYRTTTSVPVMLDSLTMVSFLSQQESSPTPDDDFDDDDSTLIKSSSLSSSSMPTSFHRSVGDVVQGLHGSKYQFQNISDGGILQYEGRMFAEMGYSSGMYPGDNNSNNNYLGETTPPAASAATAERGNGDSSSSSSSLSLPRWVSELQKWEPPSFGIQLESYVMTSKQYNGELILSLPPPTPTTTTTTTSTTNIASTTTRASSSISVAVEIHNEERSWERFCAFLIPDNDNDNDNVGSSSSSNDGTTIPVSSSMIVVIDDDPIQVMVQPNEGMLAPRGAIGGINGEFSDTARLVITMTPSSRIESKAGKGGVVPSTTIATPTQRHHYHDHLLWLVIGTESETWTYRLRISLFNSSE